MMEPIEKQLVAPCGMNCAICSGYLAFKNSLPKKPGKVSHCQGCRPRNKQCAFLKKRCRDGQRLLRGEIDFCFECNHFPCPDLQGLDGRYRQRYGMSMIENLLEIRKDGLQKFLARQRRKYRCPGCGGLICIHNKKCYVCDTIHGWNE